MKDRILLFIPAYNCEKQIVRVLDSLTEEVLEYLEEIIVVNNLSTDGTQEAALSYAKAHPSLPLKILRNHQNYGLGGSHKVAFSYAQEHGFDYVIVLHGDAQGEIRDFLPMLKRRLYRRYDCVLGARFMRGSRLKGYSLFRTFGNVVYDFLFAFVTRRRIFDLGSGLNLYSVSLLKSGYYRKFPDDLTFNYCMVMALSYYDQSARFYPISWSETDQVSNVKMGKQALGVLQMLFHFWCDPSSLERDFRQKKIAEYRAEQVK